MIVTSDPGSAAAATAMNAAEEMSPGTRNSRPVSRWPPLQADRPALDGDRGAERRQRPFRMIRVAAGSMTDGLAARLQASQQHGGLHLGAGRLGREVDAGEVARREW